MMAMRMRTMTMFSVLEKSTGMPPPSPELHVSSSQPNLQFRIPLHSRLLSARIGHLLDRLLDCFLVYLVL